MFVSAAVAVAGAPPAVFAAAVDPVLTVDGDTLQGATVAAPFTTLVSHADAVAGAVTWLFDDSYVGKDQAAPYEWTVSTATPGSHKLKARWVTGTDPATGGEVTASVSATFTVDDVNWEAPKTVYEEPGPALKSLWVTADNRRKPIDGLYDWSKAGFGGGTILPTDANVRSGDECRITAAELKADFDVVPDDGADDTGGLQKAIDQIKSECSPTGDYTKESRILLPAGTLNVSHELSLDADYLIIRGAGSGAGGTRLVYAPDANTRYDKITADGTRWDPDAMVSGDANGGWMWPGRGLLRVQTRAVADKYATQYAAAPANRKDLFEGTVNDHWTNGLRLRGKPSDANYAARKGDTTVYLAADASFDNLKVGGLVNVMAANSEKFYEQMQALPTEYDLQNLHMRQQVFMVTAGDPFGKTITLDKPLEYDLPVDSTSDGSAALNGKVFDSKVAPLVDAVVGVGIENLTMTQVEPSLSVADAKNNYGNMDPAGAMHGIVFKWAANSWVKNVHTEMTGSHPIVTEVASNLSIVDNQLDGSWNKGKGGNGYFRGSRVWDSLYAGNTTRNLRHFTFQWSASGNVAIGNSFDSDMNLHGGYERNNLFELNEVSVPYEHRSAACSTNCGDEGGSQPDDSDWYPIWWAAGKKAVKWSGSSGPNNVFFDNHLRKQLGNETMPYTDYTQYNDPHAIYRFGVDSGGDFHHLDQGGTAIADWAHNETADYTNGHGVDASKKNTGRSLFIKSVTLQGYGGPHPQPLRRTWGCSCWDGRGMVNTRLAADPVNTATGSLMETFTDASIAGVGTILSWDRTYNSLDPTVGPFGQGWTFGFNTSVSVGTDGAYIFRDPSGAQTAYSRGSDGTYTPLDPGVTATMTDRSGGGWQIKNQAGDRMSFDSAGHLVADVDEQGRGVTATYSSGKLATLTDVLGQTFTITWGTSGAADARITGVAGSDGHSVSYGYTVIAGASRLTSVVGIDGKTTTYSYDAATGYLNGVTDPLGKTTAQTVYDPATGRVIAQTDAAGGHWTFAWDQATETATITDPAGVVRKDLYQGNVLVTQLDAAGRATDVYYDDDNQVIATNTAGQEMSRNEYDARGNLTKRTLPSAVDQADPPFEAWTYDDDNHVTSSTDVFGKTTDYTYNAAGQLTKTDYPDGTSTSLTYTSLGRVASSTDQLQRTSLFEYNSTGDLIKQTTPGGAVTTYTWDSAHNKLSETDPRGNVAGASAATKEKYTSHYTYDAAGRTLTAIDGLDHTTTYTYDANGQLLTVTEPNDALTTYTYDANGNVLTETDHYGHVITHAYDAAGREISVVGPDGAKTTSSYDAMGRLAGQTAPAGNVAGADAETVRRNTTTYVYDAEGRLLQARVVDPDHPDHYLATTTGYDARGLPVTVTDPAGAVTRSRYDAAGRLIETIDPTGATATVAYDEMGREKTRTAAGVAITNTYDDAGQLKRTETGGGAATTYAYDADGNQSSVVEPRGNVTGADPAAYRTSFEYDGVGNQTKVTDPLGRSVKTYYDAANQVSKVLDPDNHAIDYGYDSIGNVNKVTTATGAVTQYSYDKISQLKTVTNPAGKAYTYTYDNASRIKTATTPTGRVTSYTYTPNGQPSKVTLPSGTITSTYDTLGRTTKTDYSDTATPDVTYSYDPASRPLTVSNGTTTAQYAYDDAGRVAGIVRGSQASSYDYDGDGRLTKRTFPDGRSQTYTWGTDSRLTGTTLTAGATSHLIDYGYDPAGRLTSTTRDGTLTTTFGYDTTGALTGLATRSGDTTLVSQNIAWTAAGNPTKVATTRAGATSTSLYTYDDAGQITGICRPASGTTCAATDPATTYTYNPTGTRATSTTVNMPDPAANKATSYTYDDDDRTLTATTGTAVTSFGYDANGNLTSEAGPTGTRTYAYRLDGNLASVGLASGTTIAYAYDEAGNRTSRTRNGTLDATWTWDTATGNAVRLDETDAAGNLAHQWWADPHTDLGTATADTAGADPVWLIGDFQGSITDLVTDDAITGSATLDPYGEILTSTGNYTSSPLRFHGQYIETTTGLYDMRARDYNSATGAFTTPDPVPANAGSAYTTTYHYGFNRPTVLTDPSGQCAIICTALIGGAIGAVAGGVDCYFSGDSWSGCGKKIAIGAAVGAAVGAGAGWIAGSTLPGWGAAAATIGLEGAGGVAYGAGTRWANGQGYGWSDVGRDFATGAAFGGAARAVGAAGRALGVPRAIARGLDWLKRNTPGPKPKNLGTVRCAPDKPSANVPAHTKTKAKTPSSGPGCNSFTGDTPVQLADGHTIPIADLRVGDRILAADPYTGRTRAQTVTALHINQDTQFVDLGIRDHQGDTAVLHTTAEHPFWNPATRAWTVAADLQPGDSLRTADGRTATAVDVRAFSGARTMYNLTVTTDHTYYVLAGNIPVLVHNDDTVPRWARDEIARIKAGQGTPRMTGNDQTLYQGNESAAHARKWGPHAESGFGGSPEWEVQGKGNTYRIVGPNRWGEYGYTDPIVKYKKITVVPSC